MKRPSPWFTLLCFLIGITIAYARAEKDFRPITSDIESPVPCVNQTVACTSGPCGKLVVRSYDHWIRDPENYEDFGTLFSYSDDATVLKLNEFSTCFWSSKSQSNLNLTSDVQDLSVYGNRPPGSEYFLKMLIPELSSLQNIYWHSKCVPGNNLLDVFELSHPSARLHYTYSPYLWYAPQDQGQLPTSLMGRKSLYSLDAAFSYDAYEAPCHMPTLEKLITAAPNLKELRIRLDHGGCVVTGEQPYAFDFTTLEEGQKFPPLEVMEFSNYNLDAIADGDWPHEDRCRRGVEDNIWKRIFRRLIQLRSRFNSIMHITSRTSYEYEDETANEYSHLLPICRIPREDRIPNIEKWLKHMDWTEVRNLTINAQYGHHPSDHVFSLLATRMPKLQNLTLRRVPIATTIDLLANLTRPLSALTIIDPMYNVHHDSLMAISPSAHLDNLYHTILEHAEGLEALTMWSHEDCSMSGSCSYQYPEDTCSRSAGTPLYLVFNNSSRNYRSLAHFPHLATLAIEMPRSENISEVLSQEVVQFLASAPSLTDLTLRFPSAKCARADYNQSQAPVGNMALYYAADVVMYNEVGQFSNETVTSAFHSLRDAQHAAQERFYAATATASRSPISMRHEMQPKLQRLDTYIGDWEWRRTFFNSMLGPPDPPGFYMGHWRCEAYQTVSSDLSQPQDKDTELPEQTGQCQGGLFLPEWT